LVNWQQDRSFKLAAGIYGKIIFDMIKKVVKKLSIEEASSPARDLEYWLSRPPEERLEAVDFLRKQIHGDSVRLQRTARVIKRSQG
jgi:hypothetical protein